MLIRAAAQQWGVPASECQSDLARDRSSGRAIAKPATESWPLLLPKLPVPKKEELQFKPKSAWRYVGKGTSSYDLADICTGKAGYGMDARLDGMVYASIEHPPVLGGKVKSYDEKAPLQVRGVKQTIPIKPFTPPHHFQPLGGVAVIADNTWAAFQGRKKLNVSWDNGANASYNSDAYKKELQADGPQARQGGAEHRRRGCRVCQGRKDRGGGLLRPASGARHHGAAGRAGGLSATEKSPSGLLRRIRRRCRRPSPRSLAFPKKT